ncbi:Phospholipase A-2-activating protein [Porphyridium purpureum]|uniref:Phospholipase A-2-activating protein n=1 Tax=Porphyridium purpureum TaxID=35688 RepID=A0A5J4YZP2_PORPP|nr:Phospholipase A-2-activating protein [Porphyridium purpureum]|eukprot:POR2817..scf208_2
MNGPLFVRFVPCLLVKCDDTKVEAKDRRNARRLSDPSHGLTDGESSLMGTPVNAMYKLRAELSLHTGDVRCVTWLGPGRFASASRDKLVVVWKEESGLDIRSQEDQDSEQLRNQSAAQYHAEHVLHGHEHYVNALRYLPSLQVLVSASADKTLRAWDVADGVTLGVGAEHSQAICALEVLGENRLVSCSWDHTARVWSVQREGASAIFKCDAVISSHKAPVWDACAIERLELLFTVGADKKLCAFNLSESGPPGTMPVAVVENAHEDVIRGVRALPPSTNNSDKSVLVTVANDGWLRTWTVTRVSKQEVQIQPLRVLSDVHGGHFIYTLSVGYSSLPDGLVEIHTGGEDSTLRVIEDDGSGSELNMVQSLQHPGTVWSIASCIDANQHDLVTGCSDQIVRVFTRRADRVAPEEVLAQYEASIKERKVASQTIGGVDVSKLPDETALLVPGKREGENKIIKNSATGVAEVHMWESSSQSWSKVGDVVDNPNSSGSGNGAKEINGVPFDFVFDVEVDTNGPHLKLGYNTGENPYTAAQRFIEDNEMSQEFLDQIANFIEQQVPPSALMPSGPNAAASDPLTGGSRYIPSSSGTPAAATGGHIPDGSPLTEGRYRPGGSAAGTSPSAATAAPIKYIPNLHELVLFKHSDMLEKMHGKILEYDGEPQIDDATRTALAGLFAALSAPDASQTALMDEQMSAVESLLQRPVGVVFPVLDLARLIVSRPSGVAYFFGKREGAVLERVLELAQMADAPPPVLIMSGRFLCNLFISRLSVNFMQANLERVLRAARPMAASQNAKAREAFSGLVWNYATLLHGAKASAVQKGALLACITELLNSHLDTVELHVFRQMVAMGTCMYDDKEAVALANELNVPIAVANAARVSARTQAVAEQIARLLIL